MINDYENGGLNMVGTASFTKIAQDCLDLKVRSVGDSNCENGKIFKSCSVWFWEQDVAKKV